MKPGVAVKPGALASVKQLKEDFEGTLERLRRFLEMRPLHAVPPKLISAHDAGPCRLSPT